MACIGPSEEIHAGFTLEGCTVDYDDRPTVHRPKHELACTSQEDAALWQP